MEAREANPELLKCGCPFPFRTPLRSLRLPAKFAHHRHPLIWSWAIE